MEFNLYILAACFLLLCFLVDQEIKRSNKHWLAARLVATSWAVAALTLMVIPITVSHKNKQQNTTLNLLTSSFHADSLDRIPHQKYFLDETLAPALKRKASYLPDLAYHLAANPAIKKVSVYGDGLTDEELKKLGNIPLEFYPTEKPNGVIACHWKDQLHEGETLTIQGQYHNSSSKALNLKLIGFGRTLDSTKIAAKAMIKFSLQHPLRHKGQALLKLVALQEKDTLNQEVIPIQTLPKTALKIIILGSSPGFEYNFLKRWLYENQYAIALRNRISKAQYSIEFLNRASIDLNRLSAKLLQKEDVLLIDQEEFENLSASEKQAIKQAVGQGLGLILLAQAPNSTEPWLKNLNLIASKKQEKINQLSIGQTKLSALPEQTLFLMGNIADQQVLVYDGASTVALQKLYGKGKIVATTLPQSYLWSLAGHQHDYALYWTTLLEAAARTFSPIYLLQAEGNVPSAMSRLNFSLTTPTATVPLINDGQKTYSSKQNMLFDNRWQVYYWPLQSGWQHLNINNQTQHFFVFGNENWQALKATQRITHNLAYASSHPSSNALAETTVLTQKPISKWWFFMAFVIAAGFLWAESRLYHRN